MASHRAARAGRPGRHFKVEVFAQRRKLAPDCDDAIYWRGADQRRALEGDKPSFENRKEDVAFKDVLLWN